MKNPVSRSTYTSLTRRIPRLASFRLLAAVAAGCLSIHPQSAEAGLSFVIGTPTSVGSVQYSSVTDSGTITAALTGPGTITSGLSISGNRIQYDIINSDQGALSSWTIYYGAAVGPFLIGATTPLGYITSSGTIVPQGGVAYMTEFNMGYGLYAYNSGAPWTIDYEVDHVTFTATGSPATGIPPLDGEGELNPTPYLPSFAIEFDPSLTAGLVPASAIVGSGTLNGQVYGPLPGNQCLIVRTPNVVVQTCSNCIPVTFSSTVIDQCCSNASVSYTPQSGTCFEVNTVTTVEAVASDSCGNLATNYFTVTVNPGPDCLPTNCININILSSNIVVATCEPCTLVAYTNVIVTDACCPSSGVKVTFNPPTNTCFPVNSTTPVQVKATDGCGNAATNTFFVTVVPGPTCGQTNCLAIHTTNITVYTCSNCVTVPFNAVASDFCCPDVRLIYSLPTNSCFQLNTTTPVEVTAVDNCGNRATNFFTVTVLPAPGCGGASNCISLFASNIVVRTCSNCVMVPFNARAFDTCCSNVTLTYSMPTNACFQLNTMTPVNVVATDECSNTVSTTFTVSIVPGPNCGGTGGPQITMAGIPNPAGGGTNFVVSWNPPNSQLQQSPDLINWFSIPGATNSPYTLSNQPAMNFYRLQLLPGN